jgi:hypothetical protein
MSKHAERRFYVFGDMVSVSWLKEWVVWFGGPREKRRGCWVRKSVED